MLRTCNYVGDMPKMIQLRHVPDAVHRKLKARAALKGVSLSDYLVREVTQIASQPTLEELIERVASRGPAALREPAVVSLRKERQRG